MFTSGIKYFILLSSIVIVFSCKKDAAFDEETYYKSSFNQNGKTFVFDEKYSMNSLDRTFSVAVPAGAVQNWQTLEHYVFYANDQNLTYYQINAMFGDVILLRSTCQQLDTAALITMPVYLNVIFSPTYYVPHKIKTDGRSDLLQALNDTTLWQTIPTYTLNTSNNTVSFYTRDLNAVYALAEHK